MKTFLFTKQRILALPLFMLIAALCSFCEALQAKPATQETGIPTSINLSDFPAASVQDVVVPVPSEIFTVLDKLGNPNWKAQLSLHKTPSPNDRAQVALLLGCVIAEGFIAVEAEDTERVKELGRDVLKLADAINVRKSVITRCKSITDMADHRDWHGVRIEFDGALQDVRSAMDEMNDEDLAQLVSLGGWLRGTNALTAIVNEHYTPAGAELLHQPELVHYFIRCINGMSPRLKKNTFVIAVDAVLKKIAPIIDEKSQPVGRKKVQDIQDWTHQLVLTTSDLS